jgi:hypothetical protein
MDRPPQEWFSEWFVTGVLRLPILAQGYPDDQAEHTFGVSLIPPYFDLPDEVDNIVATTGAFNWFFGTNRGTTSGAVPGGIDWFLNGIHNAGPKLTPNTFKQGLSRRLPRQTDQQPIRPDGIRTHHRAGRG